VDFSYYRRGERTSIQGAGVQAVLSGQVALALADSFPYGNIIIVETPGDSLSPDLAAQIGLMTGEALYILYAHLDAPPTVAPGEQVAACQRLGAVGKSGNAGIAHLHLEIRIGPAGVRFERMAYYTAQASEAEKAEYLRWRISGDFRHINPMILLSGE
jgi:murein DD-endopeptidase MepM/ murein hydrolase activator NlpD